MIACAEAHAGTPCAVLMSVLPQHMCRVTGPDKSRVDGGERYQLHPADPAAHDPVRQLTCAVPKEIAVP